MILISGLVCTDIYVQHRHTDMYTHTYVKVKFVSPGPHYTAQQHTCVLTGHTRSGMWLSPMALYQLSKKFCILLGFGVLAEGCSTCNF